jgi:hypothetical protein
MSLIAKEKSESTFTPIPEGTYAAVCNLLVDLGVHYNPAFDNRSERVMIGWIVPDETYTDKDGKTVPRTLTQEYSNSLSKKSNLRPMLASWRGKDFTPEELKGFSLRNVVGAPCLLNVIHKQTKTGKTFAAVSGVMRLPRTMNAPKLEGDPILFDFDSDPLDQLAMLPEWIANKVKESETYMDKAAAQINSEVNGTAPAALEEIPDGAGEDELPF